MKLPIDICDRCSPLLFDTPLLCYSHFQYQGHLISMLIILYYKLTSENHSPDRLGPLLPELSCNMQRGSTLPFLWSIMNLIHKGVCSTLYAVVLVFNSFGTLTMPTSRMMGSSCMREFSLQSR
jgi:hypothetical protein